MFPYIDVQLNEKWRNLSHVANQRFSKLIEATQCNIVQVTSQEIH